TAAALVDLSTVAGNKISNPPWVKFQSAGWVNFPSAPTTCITEHCHATQGVGGMCAELFQAGTDVGDGLFPVRHTRHDYHPTS
ncbi:hypothetical protein, partial [Pseudomonas aeruginosa]|uniref:hypothetical protein n=1 Tax=Pseudomonas aeruginosa TaxID=287 RepID=UPI002902360E